MLSEVGGRFAPIPAVQTSQASPSERTLPWRHRVSRVGEEPQVRFPGVSPDRGQEEHQQP